MRKLLGLLAAGFFVIGVAGQASAAALGFQGTFALQLATLSPVTVPGTGTAIVNGSAGSGHLTSLNIPASPFAITGFVLPITDPSVFPIAGVGVTAHNGDGAFSGSGGSGSFGGPMPILGASKVCLFGPCSSAVANLNVPLSVVGGGGSAVVTAAVNITVVGAPWTTGTAAIGTITAMGSVSPLSSTGKASGNITLVTPVFISTNVAGSEVVPAFAFLSLHFVPEPGTLMLLGSGIAGLLAYGRSRARK